MPQVQVTVQSVPPSFARFMYNRHEDFGVNFTAKSCSYGVYNVTIEDKRLSFKVRTDTIDGKYITIVTVPSDKPSVRPPDWLQKIVDDYAKVLLDWTDETELPIVVKYVYLNQE